MAPHVSPSHQPDQPIIRFVITPGNEDLELAIASYHEFAHESPPVITRNQMALHCTSRGPSRPNAMQESLSLASVLRAITAADLPPARARDMASAVRSIARLLDRVPEALPVEPRMLARLLDNIAPAAHGITPQRWANIRSLLRAGLALLGPIAPGRHLNALSPTWQMLWDSLPSRFLKIGLSRVMRFCSAQEIAPGDVDVGTFEQFAADVRRSLLKDPEGALRSARCAWGCALGEVPGWPAIKWPQPSRRKDHFCLPWTTFPESLQQDAAAWIARLRGDDLLTEGHRPLRPESLKNRHQRLRAFASALVHRGRAPATLRSLADLVDPDTAKEGLRFYLERVGNKAGPGVAKMANILLSIARHHVKAPPAQIIDLKVIVTRVTPPRRHGMVERNRQRLRPFDDTANQQALLHLPQRLLAQADAKPCGERSALLVQTALAIELFLVAPMRIKNLAEIDIEQHLTRPGRNRQIVVLSFMRDEVKNSQVLDFPLPVSTVALLERYLTVYRPLLAAPGSTALFPGTGGRAKGRSVLGPRISNTIFQHTGLRVHPHLFRHIAAKLQLEAEPGSYELVRRVLGHTSIETTTRAYAGTETAAAVRHYDRTIERLRRREAPE